jgi:hypothetical protein
MAQVFVADGVTPQFSKSSDLVEEIFAKLKAVLHAKPFDDANYLDGIPLAKTFNGLSAFASCQLSHPNATLENFGKAIDLAKSRAIDRLDAFNMLLKIMQCSCSNCALLTVSAIVLVVSPILDAVIISRAQDQFIRVDLILLSFTFDTQYVQCRMVRTCSLFLAVDSK